MKVCLSQAPRVLLWLWKFPKIRGALFWGPYNKDPTM